MVYKLVQDELSGADIKAICTEAGLLALRERRMKVHIYSVMLIIPTLSLVLKVNISLDESSYILGQVCQEDFEKAKENVLYRKQEGTPAGLYM